MPPSEAEILDWPRPAADAMAVELRLTTEELEELHTAEPVRFCELPSLKVPVAASCSLEPVASEALGALTLIDCRAGPVMVKATAFDEILPWLAVRLAEPAPIPVAKPVALTVATAVFDEAQVTELVRSCVVPSLNVPMAVNWSLPPFAIDTAGALMTIDCNTVV